MFKETGNKEYWLEDWRKVSPKFVAEGKFSEEIIAYTDGHIDLILSEMDKAQQILDALQEPNHLLHLFLDNAKGDEYWSASFVKKLNDNIVIEMDKIDGAENTLTVICSVSLNGEKLDFYNYEGEFELNIG